MGNYAIFMHLLFYFNFCILLSYVHIFHFAAPPIVNFKTALHVLIIMSNLVASVVFLYFTFCTLILTLYGFVFTFPILKATFYTCIHYYTHTATERMMANGSGIGEWNWHDRRRWERAETVAKKLRSASIDLCSAATDLNHPTYQKVLSQTAAESISRCFEKYYYILLQLHKHRNWQYNKIWSKWWARSRVPLKWGVPIAWERNGEAEKKWYELGSKTTQLMLWSINYRLSRKFWSLIKGIYYFWNFSKLEVIMSQKGWKMISTGKNRCCTLCFWVL